MADCFTSADRTQLKTHSPEGPTNGQRRVNQEKEEDGGENGEAIPKIRILSTLSVDTGSREATARPLIILQARAGNLLSLIVSGTIWLDMT